MKKRPNNLIELSTVCEQWLVDNVDDPPTLVCRSVVRDKHLTYEISCDTIEIKGFRTAAIAFECFVQQARGHWGTKSRTEQLEDLVVELLEAFGKTRDDRIYMSGLGWVQSSTLYKRFKERIQKLGLTPRLSSPGIYCKMEFPDSPVPPKPRLVLARLKEGALFWFVYAARDPDLFYNPIDRLHHCKGDLELVEHSDNDPEAVKALRCKGD